MSSDGAERVARHHDAQRRRGLKLAKVWVPESCIERLQQVARQMRLEANLPLPMDNASPFPGWAYVRVERAERELQAKLKQHDARWLKDERVWRIRADRICELDLQDRVVSPPESRDPKAEEP